MTLDAAAPSPASLLARLTLSLPLGRGGGGHSGGGGGHSFGGGSSFGSRSGSRTHIFIGGGGGFGFLVFLLFVFGVFWVFGRARNARSSQSVAFSAPAPGRPGPSLEAGLQEIMAVDPGFTLQEFEAEAADVFYRAQAAWSALDERALEPLMLPPVRADWEQRINEFRARGARNVMDGLTLDRIEPLAAGHGAAGDSISVFLHARAADYEVDAQTGQYRSGDRALRPFTERWNFVRPVQPSSAPVACPACHALVPLTQELCACGAPRPAPRRHWILARIDQV